MRVKKLNSQTNVLIRPKQYLIDWDIDGASKLEKQFRDLIRPYWCNQIVLFQFRIPGSKLRIDFLNCNKRIAVEINGLQHNRFNKHFHRKSRLVWLESIKRDLQKGEWCQENEIQFLELEKKDLDSFDLAAIEERFEITLA